MSYRIKEIFYTLQGEGARAGRASVFCRFSGCNLWTGREEDRPNAKCNFCDTDFVGTNGDNGGIYSAQTLVNKMLSLWLEKAGANSSAVPYVVLTGGEPSLQVDQALIAELKKTGFEIAIETNGTYPTPAGVDWITVSPKPNSDVVQRSGSELKLVYPQVIRPEEVASWDFTHFYLSPLDSFQVDQNQSNLQSALDYCLAHPQWRLTSQNHKLWRIP